MSGFEADLAAIATTVSVLRATADAVTAAAGDLDASASAAVGPGRLGPAAAGLVDGARQDLDRVLAAVSADADLVEQVRRSYAELDLDVAARLDRDPW